MGSVAKKSWDKTIQGHQGQSVDIYRNPTKRELLELFRTYGVLRADLEDVTGDLLVWDSAFATHSDIQNHYATCWTFMYLEPDRILANDINFHTEECGDVGYGPFLLKALSQLFENSKLLAAYAGELPTVIGRDCSNDEDHIITMEFLAEVA